jgi:hypothetical protein
MLFLGTELRNEGTEKIGEALYRISTVKQNG